MADARMTTPQPSNSSPSWGSTTKLVVALTIVAIMAALLVRFEFILSPILIAFVFAYLLHPVASLIHRTRLSWQVSVSLIYLFILLLLLSLLTVSGVGLVQQVQSVIRIAQDGLVTLPALIQSVSGQVYQFGPFQVDFRSLDLNALSTQVLGMIQPLLSRTGDILSTIASGAASVLGWTLFVLLVSYFALLESGGMRGSIFKIEIPGYSKDIKRLRRELGHIWNAFLRGQVIIFFMTVLAYSIVLSILGVRYAIGLAFVAGVARFVPYVGPLVNYLVLCLVTYFQPYKFFDLSPLTYMLIVIGVCLVVDQIFDNLVSPRIMSQALKVHPAAVLVSAIICASLLGILGVVVAAPMLATVTLFFRYTMRKMLDLDPWPTDEARQTPPLPGSKQLAKLRRFWRRLNRSRHPQA